MNVVSIGGGPAGLYFAILMKKAHPESSIRVLERNRPEDTFGFGVVFSDETLANFEAADAESYRRLTAGFRTWRDIHTYYRGECTVSRGHGFAAMSRQRLLLLLQERCRELGVEIEFEREVRSLAELSGADLVIGADGVNSFVRRELAERFRPTIEEGACRFCWLGTDKPLEAFTFIFEQTEHGLFQVHAYPYDEARGTWIVECREEAWRRAGLADSSEEETVAFCEELFADHLGGHRLFANRSIWRRFPTVRCETWVADRVVLLGDAAHTAHFSIGSGTKLAMEDAMALAAAFEAKGLADVTGALAAYEDERWVDVLKVQKAARTSLHWFENSERYFDQEPLQFTFNLMTRSKRITYDNLKRRDPELIERLDVWFRKHVGETPPAGTEAVPPAFVPFHLRDMRLQNRIVVSPMCQYSAQGGAPNDWHLVHLGSRAIGGAGLVMTEMTDVLPEGRITPGCAGMYAPEHVDAWRRIVDFVHQHSEARIGLQLAHAGRKSSLRRTFDGPDVPLPLEEGGWQPLAPSPLPFEPGWPMPRAMDRRDMERVRDAFAAATRRAVDAGFDLVEVHMAHGYLLSSFLTPLANLREDEYGGSLENRMRFPLEVFEAVRHEWPADRPVAVRLTATDWMEDGSGMDVEEAVEVARRLAAAGCDLIDVSSGGNAPESKPDWGRMVHVPFAERIRYEVGVPVAVVGSLLGADHANTVIAAGRADLAVMARAHLRDPYLTLHAAETYGHFRQVWPDPYLAVRPRPPRPKPRKGDAR
jgi:anthraniloyl-CoA monooxygenase